MSPRCRPPASPTGSPTASLTLISAGALGHHAGPLLWVIASAGLGFALSTTQVASGSILGAGLGRRLAEEIR